VDIGDAEGTRALDDEALADRLLAEGEVTGAGVEDHIDPLERQIAAGAMRDPGVLADLEAQLDAAAVEVKVAQGHVDAGDLDVGAQPLRPRLEPARLVVNAVAGEVLLGDDAGEATVDGEGGAVVDGLVEVHR